MKQWWQQWLLVTPGVFLADWAVDGIAASDWKTLLLVAAVLGTLNVVLKPILIVFALPFVVFTLGFGIVLINAVLVLLVGAVVPGFEVASFGAAFWAALIISLVSMFASVLLGDTKRVRVQMSRTRQAGPSSIPRPPRDPDVIDV